MKCETCGAEAYPTPTGWQCAAYSNHKNPLTESKQMAICSRTACKNQLNGEHCAIWNDPSTGKPRLYCVPCARKIIDANKWDILKLKYEYRHAAAPPSPAEVKDGPDAS